MANILIVEDEPRMRRLLEISLSEDGHSVHTSADAETGLLHLRKASADLVVTDLKLPGMNGLEFLQEGKRLNPALPFIVMTAYGSVETAVDAMKAGASDYVLKPFTMAEMKLVINKELDVQQVRDENVRLKEALGKRYHFQNIVGRSKKMQEVLALVERVAPTNSTVLIGGESGVGKDLIARAIHQNSRRASGPFIKINSTAIPETLFESEEHLKHPVPTEDDTAPSETLRGTLKGDELNKLRVCRHFWIEAGNITRNRGRHLPGNQLMMKRLSRVFFGFEPVSVPENSPIGRVSIRII